MMKLKYLTLTMALVIAVVLTGCSADRENKNSMEPINPTNSVSSDDNSRVSGNGGMMDNIGDAAGDLARGTGDVVRDAGDAIGNAANDVGRAMR